MFGPFALRAHSVDVTFAGATLALLVVSAPASAQDAPLEERIRKIVDVRYSDAPEDHRALVARRMAAVLGGRLDVSPEKIETYVKQLDQTFQYVRSFVHPYDMRAQGSTDWPPLPDAMKARQLDLELRWTETYFRDGLEARSLTAGSRESITRQVDGLINQVRNVISGRVVGPYAQEAIDGKLMNMRHHLLGTFDSPVSANFPRLMTSAEVEGILEQVQKSADELKDNFEVNESMGKLRNDAFMDTSRDPDARARRDQMIKRYNEIAGTIDGLSKPLYDVFDVWGPERAKISKELKQLSKEVQAWRLEAAAEMNRKAREKNQATAAIPVAPPNVIKPAESPPAPAIPTRAPPIPKPKLAEPEPATSASGTPWGLIALLFIAILLTGLSIRRILSKQASE